jgi:uncharacterized protein (TIGR03643 family)
VIAIPPAGIATISYLLPTALPFFTPGEWSFANGTYFYRQFGFFHYQRTFGCLKGLCVMIPLNPPDIDRIIEMAWEDRTPFEAIAFQFGLSEQEVIELMRRHMKGSSFRMWRKRMQGRQTKHAALREFDSGRHKCSRQRTISRNKISKRR